MSAYKNPFEEALKSDEKFVSDFEQYLNYDKAQYAESIIPKIENRVNKWLKNNSTFIENFNYKSQNQNGYMADYSDWLSTITTQKNNFDREAESIKSVLNEYKDVLSADYIKQINDALDGAGKVQTDIFNTSTEWSNYYSQWESEDDYNATVEAVKERERLLGLDVEATRAKADYYDSVADYFAQIEYLKSEIALAEKEKQGSTSEKFKADMDEFIAEYQQNIDIYNYKLDAVAKEIGWNGGIDDEFSHFLKQESGNFRADAELAEYRQKGERLKNEALSAEDFETNNRYTNFDTENDFLKRDGEAVIRGAIDNDKIYENMTEEQKKIFGYYLATATPDDLDKAYDYLDTIKEDIDNKVGLLKAEKKDNAFKKLVFSAEAGLDQFGSGIQGLYNAAIGKDEYIPPSATQVASQIIREDISKGQGFWNGALGVAYDLGTTTANMLPSILIGFANPVAGTALLGASAGGNAYNEMINLGYDKNQARAYGAMVGASEALLERAIGGMTAFGGGGSKLTAKMLTKVDNAFARWAIQTGGSMLSEFTEESLQTILEPWFKTVVTNADYDAPNIDEILYSGLLGALSAGLLEGGGNAISAGVTTHKGRQIKKKEGGVEALTSYAETLPTDTEASKLAGKVKDKASAYNVGRLYKSLGEGLTSQNYQAMHDYLVSKGVQYEHATAITDTFGKYIAGEKLSKSERKAITANPLVAQAARDALGSSVEIDAETGEYIIMPSKLQQQLNTNNEAYEDVHEALKSLAKKTAGVVEDTASAQQAVDEAKPIENEQTIASAENATEGVVEADTEADEVASPIKNIASIENGKVTYNLEDGTTSSKATTSNKVEALVYESVTEMGASVDSANSILDKVRTDASTLGEQDLRARFFGMKEVYFYGKHGISMGEISNHGFADTLTDTEKAWAYNLGKKDRVEQIAKKEEASKSKQKPADRQGANEVLNKDGLYYDKSIKKSSLTSMQRASVDVAKQIHKILGVNVHLFASYVKNGKRYYRDANGVERKAPNGMYINGDIYLDINAGQNGEGIMLNTLAHELTHHIEEWSPEKYKKLCDFLMEQYAEKGVSVSDLVYREIAKAKKNGRDVSFDEAYSDVIANSMETMLHDGTVLNKLARTDIELFNKVKAFIDKIVERIRALYADVDAESLAGKYVANMKDSYTEIQNLFANALTSAGENFNAATEKADERGADEVKFSERESEEELSLLRDEYSETRKLERDAKKKLDSIEKYPRYDEMVAAIADKNTPKEEVNEFIADYKKWQDESGYTKAYEEHKSLEEKARKQQNEIQRLEERLSKALREKKYSDEEVSKFVQKAVRKYRTTQRLDRAGYLLTTGSMLDFSDGQGYRVKDHREISEVLDLPDYAQYADGMITFMNMGNIRLQTYGIDISAMPNSKQISSLRGIISDVMREYDEFTVDFSKPNGNSDGSVTYPKGVASARILSDIKAYFETGVVPEYDDSLSQFHYSERDSNGDKLSKEQQNYFKDSKVRDEKGNLLVVYHGTRKADFTVFKRNINYFTDSESMAESYSPNGEKFTGYLNIVNPLVIDAKNAKWSAVPIDSKTKKLLDKYGASTFKEGGKWRTTPADIASAIQDGIDEGELDYDGIIIRNVDDTGSYWKEKDNNIANDYIVFNSNQFKNTTNINPTENPDIRYLEREDVDNYSQKEYNDFGWARANDVLSATENADLRSKFAAAISKQTKPPKTKAGEYMISVGDNVENKIAYMKGTIDNPIITRIIEIDEYDETKLAEMRRFLYATERRGIEQKTRGVHRRYDRTDFGRYESSERSVSAMSRHSNKLGTKRGRSSQKAKGITGIRVNDDGTYATVYSDGTEEITRYKFSERTDAALETFGTTTEVEKAGFAIPDGRMLNLSKYGLKGTNHKLIEAVYDDVKGNAAVNAFIQEGNVRLKAAAPGVEIGEKIAPTTAQLNAVSRLIRNTLYERGRFYVDITAEDGSSIASVEYGEDDSIQDIIYDIEAYYKRGKIPTTQKASAYSYFFSERVTAEEDAEYMDAYFDGDDDLMQKLVDKVANRLGYKYKAYHRSENGFTVFDLNRARKTSDIQGFYFSADKDAEREFGSVRYDTYLKMDNPYVVDSKKKMKAIPFDLSKENAGVIAREWLMSNGYDGVIRKAEYYGAEADEYIVFDANQIKSAEPMTFEDDENGEGDIIPLSQRFNSENDDIRYSERDPDYAEQLEKLNKTLEKENAKLKEDKQNLKELLTLQKKVTNGKKFTQTSVIAAAKKLMKYADAKGEAVELARMLNTYYEGIVNSENLDWDEVTKAAEPAVKWLKDHVSIKPEVDDTAMEVRKFLKKQRVKLTEEQKSEAAYSFGSYNEFRRKAMGYITIAEDATNTLDGLWQDLSGEYPEIFGDVKPAEMPKVLVETMNGLRDGAFAREARYEYEQSEAMITQDLLREVYNSYWDVSTLHTVADKAQKEINLLKAKHGRQMNDARQHLKDTVDKLKQDKKNQVAKVRKQYQDIVKSHEDKLIAKHQEQREWAKENRAKTEMRHKIKKVVNDLNRLLLHGNKERNVKIGLQPAVAAALEAINFDTIAAEQRLNGYTDENGKYHKGINQKIAEATDTDVIAALEKSRDFIQNQADSMNERLDALRKAYTNILNNKDDFPDYYREEAKLIESKIDDVIEKVGNTPLRLMNLSQLTEVHNLYTMVLTTVRNANKVFKQGKTEDLQANASSVMMELQNIKKLKEERSALGEKVRSFAWNEYKPYYAFNRIGSNTLTSFFWEAIRGEGVYAQDLAEANDFQEATRKKYGYSKWNTEDVHEFRLEDGRTFQVSLKQMMSIYAYSKRKQALDHMSKGGFFFNDKATFRKKGKLLTQIKSNEEGYRINEYTLDKIKAEMTEEQIKYVDEMQSYLTSMGAKGNEVTRVIWGIDIFNEAVYFPLRSVKDFIYQSNQPAQESSLKNDGMTKETKPGASNPIVLESFDDVWASHVERMSQYHGLVIPIDNLNKILNYGTWANASSVSVSTMLTSRFGSAANEYLTQLVKDLNGSVGSQGASNPLINMFSKFKKTAVAASASVVIQQPTAILRAMSEIDPKYFVGKPNMEKLSTQYAELKKYAPVAIIKEIGGFDAGSGRQATEWLNADTYRGIEKVKRTIDDATMWGAAKADEIGWSQIWDAVKRECVTKYTNLAPNSEEFLKKAGERFTEVIVKTQVYDSTLSRSGYMRSKSDTVKMATSFMGEPTTSINMMLDAVVQAKRGTVTKREAGRKIAAVYASIIAAGAAASLIYAMRDDDDDESFVEKYIEAVTDKLVGKGTGELNPLTQLPFIKDVISIFDGWEVERSDMALIQDFYNALDALDSSTKSPYRKVEDLAGAIGAMFGIPVKNTMRSGREIYNFVEDLFDENVGVDFSGAFASGITGQDTKTPKTTKLYDAIMNGDEDQIEKLKSEYKDESSYESALRKSLRENDSRIKEAAEAYNEGDIRERDRILDEIVAEGYFEEELVAEAIKAEANALKGDKEDMEPEEEKATSKYRGDDINVALESGDKELALEIIDDLVQTKIANGMEEDKARSSVKSSVTSYWKPLYKEAYKNKDSEEMKRIRYILLDTGLYGRSNQVVETCQGWIKELAKENNK